MSGPSDTDQSLNTVLNAAKVIDAIDELDGATLMELTNHLEMATSTVHDYLHTLETAQYLVKTDDEYQLSLKLFYYGMNAQRSTGIVSTAKPILQNVAKRTGETVWLVVEEYGKSVLIEQATGENSVPMEANVGDRVPIHSIASGKAILAYRDEEHVRQIIDQYGLPARTEQTITDEETLFDELADVRERGFAVNRQESISGLRSIAASIQKDDRVLAAISIAGPANRLSDTRIRDEFGPLLLESSNEIELKMKYS